MIKLNEALTIAKEKLGNDVFKSLNLTYKSDKDSSILKVIRNGNNVEITYGELVSLFRGLTLVKEKINEQKYEISVSKHFNHNGMMVDCSRNGVANLSTLKELILIQALMGENRLLLYTEDTYKVDKYPFFGYQRGGYTKEELKEIVDYAISFGVEIIPCIQTLGHLERPLHWKPMWDIKDGPSTLLIDEDKTYEFIEDIIKFSRECFNSTEIHIGMDESTEIGLGRYLGKHPYKDRVELFSNHLAKVIKICQKYDFAPMIWSDMFFRLNSSNEEYYRDTPLPESTLKLIPEGITLVYWDYYHDDKKIYNDMFDFHKQTKRDVVFAGGSWRWKGFAPSIETSLKYSEQALLSCIEKDCKSVFMTAWGDNGNECSLFTVLPCLALYSNMDYFSSSKRSDIDSMLKAIVDEPLERMLLLDLPDQPDGKILAPSYNPSKFLLYQDPIVGIFDKQVKDNFSENYRKTAIILHNASKESKNFSLNYEVLAVLSDVLTYKVDLGVKLRKAYQENDKKSLSEIIAHIPYLINKIDELNRLFRKQWFQEFKQFGYDVIDGRLGYLKNRILTADDLVKRYLNGELEKIEELETEILPYNGDEYEISWNWWVRNVTVHNL